MMANVTEQTYVANNQILEARLAQFEGRLNDLFDKVDTRFQEVTTSNAETAAKVQSVMLQMPQMMLDMQKHGENVESKVQAVLVENRSIVIERTNQLEEANRATQDAVAGASATMNQMRSELNMITSQAGGGTERARGSSRKLIDSKNFQLKVFDGDTDTKNTFEEWREDMQDYLETFFPQISMILDKAARWGDDITGTNISDVVRAAGVQPSDLAWTYEDANRDIATFIKKYVLNRARKAFTTSRNGGFEAYRVMVNEIDPINHRTKGCND